MNAHPQSPPANARRVATIDIGTNSIRLLIAEAHADGSYNLLDDEKIVARLGRGMSSTGALREDAIDEAADTIARLHAIATGYNVSMMRAVATWAVRHATNRDAFLDRVRERTGLNVEVISGEEEARLAWLSVRSAFDISSGDVGIVDLGGGSTELILCANGLLEQIFSLPIGAVTLTEIAGNGATSAEKRLKTMRKTVRRLLREAAGDRATFPQYIIGAGGSFTSLALMDMMAHTTSADDASPPGVRGRRITRASVRRLMENLNAMKRSQRLATPGLSADRADIIVAGLAIIETIMRELSTNALIVHDRGIRDGVLLSMTRDIFPQAAEDAADPPDRIRSARRLARRCRYEQQHSEHVADLALSIHDQLADALDGPPTALTTPECREMLHTAAILHDIGYSINYARHHRHSAHLIMHSELPGFGHREQTMVAGIARYHRRAHPKLKHAHFAALDEPDREIVRQLAAILRIADGLDRAHAQHVRAIKVALADGVAAFHIDAGVEPAVDLWGAQRKSRLFRRVFDLKPEFIWRGASTQ
jgi:exopolyphosphatase/guanosine-5'-triphosphate,3'-diphosphate pyrophosphatase